MQLEEKVLRNAFPEYAAYAKRTPRLIPACGETLRHNAAAPFRAWAFQPSDEADRDRADDGAARTSLG